MAGIIMLSKTGKTEASKATTVVWRFEAIAERGATKSRYIVSAGIG